MFRLLAFGCFCLAFSACQQGAKSQQDAPAKPRPAAAPVTPKQSAPALLAHNTAPAGPRVDSLRPTPLDLTPVGLAQLRADTADAYTEVESLQAGRFLWVQTVGEAPRLLYRANPRDTTWQQLGLDFDRFERGNELVRLRIGQANLDGQGRPEALLTLESAANGSGGGTTWRSVYLLDVTPPRPLLLLQAQVSVMYEAFSGYAQLHGLDLDPDERFTGCERDVQLRQRELLLGPNEPTGIDGSKDCDLTTLAAGRYRYRSGWVLRVGK